ncbi:hypothetical protein AB3S75_019340 [Citrus x aurantiifolia]
MVSRLSSRLQSLWPTLKRSSLSPLTHTFQTQASASTKPIFRISRLPVELSSLESMLPLHSAIASARLKSSLPLECHCWGLVPQGYQELSSLSNCNKI